MLLLVRALCLASLLSHKTGMPTAKGVEVARKVVELVALEQDDVGGDGVEEVGVVRDE